MPRVAAFRAGLLLLVAAVVLAACSNNSPGSGMTQIGSAVGVAVDLSSNVCISGMTGIQTGNTDSVLPSYWKNGSLTQMYVVPNTYFWADWDAVDTSGNVYVAGATGSSSNAPTPAYWENGSPSNLSLGSGNAYGLAYNAAVDGSGNVYMIGKVGTSSSAVVPCYWENGTLNILSFGSTGSTYGYAVGVAFDGSGNVYIAGRIGSSSSALVPCYWVVTTSSLSGTPYTLTMKSGDTYGVARNIAIAGTAVYISGIEGPSSSSISLCYWKGTTSGVANPPTDLPLGTGNTAWTLYWAGLDASGNFYMVGDVGTSSSSVTPSYWEITSSSASPSPVSLSTGHYTGGEASGIAFDSSSNVYVAGTVGSQVPCYWKNGVLDTLTTGSSKSILSMRSITANQRDPTLADSGHQGP